MEGISNLGKNINREILSQKGIRHVSIRDMARMLGRSDRFVRDRVDQKVEWDPKDIEALCEQWGIPEIEFFENALSSRNSINQLTDEERKLLILAKLSQGDVTLAAHVDPHKREEMEGGDGR